MTFLRIIIPLYLFVLSMICFGKPFSTFPDHAAGPIRKESDGGLCGALHLL
jgi:hypothetical protein